jgi:glutathione synthase/RimK-type ligase-like ATP-grasp enzyme
VFSTDEEFIGCAKEVNNGEHIDSRVDQSGGTKVVDIPDEVKETTIKAMQLLGMKFSGVDFIQSGDEYFLLECNPSPMFYNFEYLSSIRVSDKLAEYLLNKMR